MAPFRGNRGGGMRGRGRGRGGGRGGRGASSGTGRIARSGIRTRGGYKKFDSQRIKEVEPVDSEDEQSEVEEESENGEQSDESSDEEVAAPKSRAYNALLQSLQSNSADEGRTRKRRKIEADHQTYEEQTGQDGDDSEDDLEQSDVVEEDGDRVDDAEEDEDEVANDEMEIDGEDSAEQEDDLTDPYEAHFTAFDEKELSNGIASVENNKWRTERQATKDIGNLTVFAPEGTTGDILRQSITKANAMRLKQRLIETSTKHLSKFDNTQQLLAPYISNYADVLFGNRNPQNAESMRSLACLHAMNHVLKGRDKVLKNTARLARSDAPEELDLRDQGFTRPKVLILLETREMAAKYADCIVNLFEPEQQENKQRFKDSFTEPIDERENMPADYRELFAGNNDNNFLTSLKFTRKTLKYFSAFYSSDIILASPLGLRRVIEHEDAKKRDYDFLSSIEVMIVDQADAMQMQSWENVELVFKHLNLQLREAHDCDFSRVRHFYLDGNAKFLRQTIVFGAYITPEMNRLFNANMQNITGKVKLAPSYQGAITSLGGLGIKQTFSRFDCPAPAGDPDARFKYFTTAVLPALLRIPKPADGVQGIMIFIPSYFDFLRIRNFFATSTLTENISFGAIHDYSEVSDQRRARSHFASGRHSMLLYTQRAHHFFRLKMRGVKRVAMYGLPDNPVFYEEMVGGFLGTSVEEGKVSPEESGVRVLMSKWDGLRLERVVGSDRIRGMLAGVGDTFDFV
ncbi:Utp25 [Acrodontium crateriforme]|uniref:U3 small nucleolar RNA-associated protein 25 n=1 Tax=Acrodontium crateriforme TaxID=150365 RepID=A0AAQ3LYM3_9PEZI|nr:Utp25 [Acrodontium crateriforme]